MLIRCFIVGSLCMLCLAAMPAAAQLGGCYFDFVTNAGQNLFECTNATEADCLDGGATWTPELCEDLDQDWLGSCLFIENEIGPCWLWDLEEGSETPMEACEERFSGEWTPVSLTCGETPVPTLPNKGVLILLLGLLMSGSYLLLRRRSAL